MSLLIEALRRAEAGGSPNAAPTVASPSTALDDTEPRQAARTLLDAADFRQPQTTPGRTWHLAVFGTLGAVLAAGAAAWWLTAQPALPNAPPPAQPPTDEQAGAPALEQAQAAVAEAPPPQPAPQRPVPSASSNLRSGPLASIAVPPPATQPAAKRAPPPAAADKAATATAAATAAATPPAPLVQPGQAVQPPLVAGYAALQAGQVDDAERLYRAALEIDPRQPDALLGLAAAAERRGASAEAIGLYRRVLALEPEHPVALAALAELSAAGDGSIQESVLRQALARRPASAALHAALARLLAAQGRWSEAQLSFAAAWELEPNSAERAYDLAVALDRLRKTEAAIGMYARALAQAGAAPGFDASAAQARLQALRAHAGAAR